jgi:predicted ester cyclase
MQRFGFTIRFVGNVAGITGMPSRNQLFFVKQPMRKIILVAALAAAMPPLCLSQATDDMKRNEDVVRHFVESINRRDVQSAVSDFAEDAKNIGRPGGRERMRHVLEDIYTTFPDYHYNIEEMIAQGDSVALRCKVSGTHRGVGKLPVNGGMLVGVEPTQKHFEIQHIHSRQQWRMNATY